MMSKINAGEDFGNISRMQSFTVWLAKCRYTSEGSLIHGIESLRNDGKKLLGWSQLVGTFITMVMKPARFRFCASSAGYCGAGIAGVFSSE